MILDYVLVENIKWENEKSSNWTQLIYLKWVKRVNPFKNSMGISQDFSIYLIKKLGSSREIFNPFKFDMNRNPTWPDLLPNFT